MADAEPQIALSADEPQAAADEAQAREQRLATRKLWLKRLAIGVLVVAIVWGLWYFLIGRNYISTDNAYVNAETAQVTPLIAGAVVEVAVKDTQAVKRGQVLARLDPAHAPIALAPARAELADAVRRFRQTRATSG